MKELSLLRSLFRAFFVSLPSHLPELSLVRFLKQLFFFVKGLFSQRCHNYQRKRLAFAQQLRSLPSQVLIAIVLGHELAFRSVALRVRVALNIHSLSICNAGLFSFFFHSRLASSLFLLSIFNASLLGFCSRSSFSSSQALCCSAH